MKNKVKYIFLAAGGLFFLFMVNSFGIENIGKNLERVGWYFIPVVAVWLVVYFFNAIAWRFIINDPAISFARLLSVTISGYAINYVTPFFHLGGEPYRIYALKDVLGISRAISVTVSYIMLHFLSSFLIWLAAVIIVLVFIPLQLISSVFLTLSLLIFGFVIILFIKGYQKGIAKSFANIIVKLPLLKRYETAVEKREVILEDVDSITRELYRSRKGSFILANIFEFLSRVAATFEFLFILKALGFNPTFLEAFIINSGLGLIANVFFIVPFEIGVKEGGLYAMLGFLNYSPAMGIFIGIVNRLRELVWILIGLLLIAVTGKGSPNKKIKNILYGESDII